MKQKVLIFHPALVPYRIDFFNSLSKKFRTTFYFIHTNVSYQSFDQERLISKCTFKMNYLDQGFEILGRPVRFGIRKIIKTENPDVIICSEFNSITILTYLYRRIFNKKYKIFTLSDDSLDNSKKRKGYRAELRNFIAKNIDGVILTSQEVCDWFKINISKKINTLILPVIHNDQVFRKGLVNSLMTSKKFFLSENLEGKKVILFVGRLVSVKNLFFLLRTAAKIKDENYCLVIVGDGILKEKLLNRTKALNINEKVIFTGHCEGDALLAWYNLANVFILPSTFEPFGAVVNEALLAGCYVLCSKRAGASSLINSTNGQIFDPSSDDELLFYLNEKLQKTEPLKEVKVKISENKMPFEFAMVIDTFLKELVK